MDVLVGIDSVHATAAICDYLERRAASVDDAAVVAVAPADDDSAERDAREALNVANVRLTRFGDVESEFRTGEFAASLLEAANDIDADEVVVGIDGSSPGRAIAESTRKLLADAPLPVVAVPVPDAA
jgi:nucleotide-binding universal stress UspA family protein